MAMQIARARRAARVRHPRDRVDPEAAGRVRAHHGGDLPGDPRPDRGRSGAAASRTGAPLEGGEARRDGPLMAGGGMTRQPRVAVVGAGLAGLTAGLALAKRGWRVDLYERSRLLGGKATSFEVDGHEVDCGQHVVLACCTATLDLVEELGLQRFALHPAAIRGDRAFAYASARAPARIRAAGAAPPDGGVRTLSAPDHARSHPGGTRAARGTRATGTPKGDMASWLRRHHQSARALRAFWDPFLVPALNAPLDRVSAEMGLFVIRTAFLGDRDAARIAYLTRPAGAARGGRRRAVRRRAPSSGGGRTCIARATASPA